MLYFHRITVETVIQHRHQILNDHSEIHSRNRYINNIVIYAYAESEDFISFNSAWFI